MPKNLSRNIVNLAQFPNITTEIAEDITIGDLHANALKLLHLLIQEGVLYTSPEQYQHFYLLYQISADLITHQELQSILSIIESLEVRNPQVFIRLVGDEHFDRGSNDLYIDMILKKLQDENVHFEIILSNHGARTIQQMESFQKGNYLYEFDLEMELLNFQNQEIEITQDLININDHILKTMQKYELLAPLYELYQLHSLRLKALANASILTPEQMSATDETWVQTDQQFHQFYFAQKFDTRFYLFYFDLQKQFDIQKELTKLKYHFLNSELMLAQRASFKNMNILYHRDLISKMMIEDLYYRYYIPHLKLLSYSIDLSQNTITIFSHAPCGIECIESIADFFNVPFQNHTLVSFAHMLDCINIQFVENYVKKECISDLLHSNSIIYEFIWNRNYDSLCRPKKMFEYHVNYVHGHDKDEINREEHVFSLDSRLGSLGIDQGKLLPIISGEDLVLKARGGVTLPFLVSASEKDFLKSLSKFIEFTIEVGHESWQFNFQSLIKIFESLAEQNSLFSKHIQFYCNYVQNIFPRVPWPLIEPQINCLEKIISLSPSTQVSSHFSFFSASINPEINELKTFLQAERINICNSAGS